MPDRRVQELAQELASRLESDEALDDESREALEALRREVERALSGGSEAVPSTQARSLVERFESDHPDLTALIQRLADALMNAGL